MNANSFFSSVEFGSMPFNSSYRSLTVETTSLLLNRLVRERDPAFPNGIQRIAALVLGVIVLGAIAAPFGITATPVFLLLFLLFLFLVSQQTLDLLRFPQGEETWIGAHMILDRTGAILQQQGQGVANLIIQFRRLVIRGRQLDERRVVELLARLVQRLQRPGIGVHS